MKTWPIDSLTDNERWNATTSKGPWKVKIIRRQGNNSWVAWGKPCDQHGQSETPHNVSSLTNWASPHVSKLFFCLQRSTNLSKVQSYKCAVVMRSHFKLAAAHRKSKAVLSSIVCRSSDFYCSFASVFSSESHPQSALLSRSSRVQALDFSKDLEKVLRLRRSWNPPTDVIPNWHCHIACLLFGASRELTKCLTLTSKSSQRSSSSSTSPPPNFIAIVIDRLVGKNDTVYWLIACSAFQDQQ